MDTIEFPAYYLCKYLASLIARKNGGTPSELCTVGWAVACAGVGSYRHYDNFGYHIPLYQGPLDSHATIAGSFVSGAHTIRVFEFVLKLTYFSYRDRFNEQVEGVAIGVPPLASSSKLLLWSFFEQKALELTPPPTPLEALYILKTCWWYMFSLAI